MKRTILLNANDVTQLTLNAHEKGYQRGLKVGESRGFVTTTGRIIMGGITAWAILKIADAVVSAIEKKDDKTKNFKESIIIRKDDLEEEDD